MSGSVIYLGSAALAALIGALLLAWALFADRAKGRKRCPKCWYDMSAAVGLRCPECGRQLTSEKQLLKTRRRWKAAFATLLPFALAGFLALQPKVQRDGWWSVMPTTLMLAYFQFKQDDAVIAAIDWRMSVEVGDQGARWHVPDASTLHDWQWRWLAKQVLQLLDDHDLPPSKRNRVLGWAPACRDFIDDEALRGRLNEVIGRYLSHEDPMVRMAAAMYSADRRNSEASIVRVLPLLEDEDERVRHGAMGALRILVAPSGIGIEHVLPTLMSLLEHHDRLVQNGAAAALETASRIPHGLEAEVMDALRAAFKRELAERGEFRYRFVSAFAQYAAPTEWLPWVRDAIHRGDPDLRANALNALFYAGAYPSEFLEAVFRELKSNDATQEGRDAASWVLQRWPRLEELKPYEDALLTLVNHDDQRTADAALAVLMRLDPTYTPGYRDYP